MEIVRLRKMAKIFYDDNGKEKTINTLLPNKGLDPFLEKQRTSWKSINKSSYQLDKEFGIVPMPGIVSADIKALNRGSIKKAIVKIKANSTEQFNILEELYLRLGYDMLLEWGWNYYVKKDNKTGLFVISTMTNTLIETEWFDTSNNGLGYTYWLPLIEEKKRKSRGNYGGFFGKVYNFDWKFNPDGSYDITLKLITHGDVIESLTVPPLKPSSALPHRMILKKYMDEVFMKDPGFAIGEQTGTPKLKLYRDKPINFDRYGGSGPNWAHYILRNLEGDPFYGNAGEFSDAAPSTETMTVDTGQATDQLSGHLFNLALFGLGRRNFRVAETLQGGYGASAFYPSPSGSVNRSAKVYNATDLFIMDQPAWQLEYRTLQDGIYANKPSDRLYGDKGVKNKDYDRFYESDIYIRKRNYSDENNPTSYNWKVGRTYYRGQNWGTAEADAFVLYDDMNKWSEDKDSPEVPTTNKIRSSPTRTL